MKFKGLQIVRCSYCIENYHYVLEFYTFDLSKVKETLAERVPNNAEVYCLSIMEDLEGKCNEV